MGTICAPSETSRLMLGVGYHEQDIRAWASHSHAHQLGWINYGVPGLELGLSVPRLNVSLSGPVPFCIGWLSSRPATVIHAPPLHLSFDGHYLWGCIDRKEGPEGLSALVENVYGMIFERLEALGYRHLLRVWNYIPLINDPGVVEERYREFNEGRYHAFERAGRSPGGKGVPSACALGTHGGGMGVAFLAGRSAGIPLENPRQIPVSQYPLRYGRHAPTFARALLDRGGLLVSGTASIVGSESRHEGDIRRQLEETLVNLRQVHEQAQRHGFDRHGVPLMVVYLRHLTDWPGIRERLQREFPDIEDWHVVEADICRAELLIEIEMFWVVRP